MVDREGKTHVRVSKNFNSIEERVNGVQEILSSVSQAFGQLYSFREIYNKGKLGFYLTNPQDKSGVDKSDLVEVSLDYSVFAERSADSMTAKRKFKEFEKNYLQPQLWYAKWVKEYARQTEAMSSDRESSDEQTKLLRTLNKKRYKASEKTTTRKNLITRNVFPESERSISDEKKPEFTS